LEIGKIIFLNGVTSSGKTTISKALQELATEYFYSWRGVNTPLLAAVELKATHEGVGY